MHEDRSSCMYYLICDLMQLHVLYICTKLICINLIFMWIFYIYPNAFLAHRRDPRTIKRSDTPKPLLNPKPGGRKFSFSPPPLVPVRVMNRYQRSLAPRVLRCARGGTFSTGSYGSGTNGGGALVSIN